jgi:hypothetical protein
MRGLCGLAVCCGVLLTGASGASAAGELTFSNCEGSPSGCTTVSLAALAGAQHVAASLTGSVYVSAGEAVSYFHGGGSTLSYGGCISSDGSGGACADTPGGAGILKEGTAIAVSPNGAGVYAGSLNVTSGGNADGVLSRFATSPSGLLEWAGCVSDDTSGFVCARAQEDPTSPLSFPSEIAVSANGKSVFVAGVGGAVSHLFANPLTGEFSYDGCISSPGDAQDPDCVHPATDVLAGQVALGVSPLAQVYVLTENETLVHLRTDPDGRLEYEGCVGSGLVSGCSSASSESTALHRPDAMVVAPNGSIYIVAQFGVMTRFPTDSEGRIGSASCGSSVNCSTGAPSEALQHATGIAASPDGKSLYVTSTSALLTFSIAANGAPVFQQCISNKSIPGCAPIAGAAGIADFAGVAVSPDGKSVYSVGKSPAYLARFNRGSTGGPGGTGTTGGGAGGGTPGGGGSAGNPLKCDGRKATIVGSARNDHLKGTKGSDVIVGLGGNDTIEGLAGNDYVCGGAGKDKLIGGAGNDHLEGEAGNDKLIGGAGSDQLVGGAGNDLLEGGAGPDKLLGGAGADTLLGGSGNDKLSGGAGRDKLKGGAGKNSDSQ